MPVPILIRIPHALGRAEARRRIENGVGQARSILPSVVTVDQISARGDELSLGVHALGQTVNANIAIEDDCVIVEASVPIFLAPFAAGAKLFTQSFGTKLLGGPSGPRSPDSAS
jgi:hypothetical protein